MHDIIFFYFYAKKHKLLILAEYLQSMFWAEIQNNIGIFLSENFPFLAVKFFNIFE